MNQGVVAERLWHPPVSLPSDDSPRPASRLLFLVIVQLRGQLALCQSYKTILCKAMQRKKRVSPQASHNLNLPIPASPSLKPSAIIARQSNLARLKTLLLPNLIQQPTRLQSIIAKKMPVLLSWLLISLMRERMFNQVIPLL